MHQPDFLDAVALVGLGLLAWGLWWVWEPLAPLVVGSLVLAGALRWAMAQARAGHEAG